jgi:hypothetical protein
VTALLLMEMQPASPELVEEYRAWHEQPHIPEMLSVDGFVSARRSQDNGESFITLYEIDTDMGTARANLQAALRGGQASRPVGVQTQPRPVRRLPDSGQRDDGILHGRHPSTPMA